MIHFEITASPDHNVKESFKFFLNTIYLGSRRGDLVICDHSLKPSHLMMEVVNGELLVHPQKEVTFFLINGKRATTIRKVRVGDTIQLGETSLKIQSFEETMEISRSKLLNQKLSTLVENNSLRLPVIEKLNKMMKESDV